jgi:putative methyltransferase (TIGR04325 family)
MRKKPPEWARDLIPPVLREIYRRFVRRWGFYGEYSRWEDAVRATSGYDSAVILEKVREALLKVKTGDAVYERDSVLFDEVQYSWPLLAALLWIVSQKGNRLSLVDFGGSLGSTYYQNRKFLAHLGEVRWSIVEQRRFVECGKRDFEDDRLKFYEDLDSCIREQSPDTILLSSVLQYLEQPYALLEKVLSLGFEFILIDRTTFLEKGDDRLTVQKVPPEIYEASYPAWFFNREKFLSRFSKRYELMAEFDALSGTIYLQGGRAADKGFIFRKSGAGGLHGV